MFCLPVHVKTSLPPAQNVNEIPVISASAVQFVHFCVTVNNSILLFVCLFIYLFICLFVYMFIYLFIYYLLLDMLLQLLIFLAATHIFCIEPDCEAFCRLG